MLDNLSAHKTHRVASFLQKHPNVKLHFTPDLLILVKSGWDLVFTHRARGHRTRRIHFCSRSLPQAHSPTSAPTRKPRNLWLEVLRHSTSHHAML